MPHVLPEPEDVIRTRAYQIWLDEGCPDGRHDIHWQRALATITNGADNSVAWAAAEHPAESAAEPDSTPDDTPHDSRSDVSLVAGIGPRFKALLAAEGIRSLAQLARMTPPELAELDAHLGLNGRSEREEWLTQAKELVAGLAPRAKVDQDRD